MATETAAGLAAVLGPGAAVRRPPSASRIRSVPQEAGLYPLGLHAHFEIGSRGIRTRASQRQRLMPYPLGPIAHFETGSSAFQTHDSQLQRPMLYPLGHIAHF